MTLPGPAVPADALAPPATGDAELDRVVAQVADLSAVPLDEHHSRLVGAHEALHAVLTRDGD